MRIRLITLLLISFFAYGSKKYTIMLSPAGDTANPGRLFNDTTERSLSRQIAEELKIKLEEDSSLRVIITHDAGEAISQEQKASFANCLADAYYAISVAPGEQPLISVFYYKKGTLTPLPTNNLTFYPANQAYIFNAAHTEKLAKYFIAERYRNKFTCNKPLAIPIKSLEGIIAPAFDIEVLASTIADTTLYIEPLLQAIRDIAHDH